MSTATAPPQDDASASESAPAGSGPSGADAPGSDGSERPGPTFEAIAIIALVVAFAAVLISVFAMGLAARSIDEHRSIAEGGGGGGPVAVSLTEFAIAPAPITVSAGGSIAVTNDGSTTHDLTVEGQDLATPTLDAGGTAALDVGALAPGTYTVFCSIPGHREAGMESSVTVG